MRISLLLLLTLCFACKEEAPLPDNLFVSASSYDLPLNEYGKATLRAEGDLGKNLTSETDFLVNGVRINGNVFQPAEKGVYRVKGVYRGMESNEIEISVGDPLNKKVLVEYFTSKGCGWCPWMGYRVDSLHKANEKVIGYAIHGDDELEVDGVTEFQLFLKALVRPDIRINRGYVRNFRPTREIAGLIDSISHFLSIQPPLEIAIQTTLNGDRLSVGVEGRISRDIQEELHLAVLLIEDNIVTFNQANFFSGQPLENGPLTSQPNPIPEYVNHNVLRLFVTSLYGDPISPLMAGQITSLGSFELELENISDKEQASVIAIVHKSSEDIEVASVLNAQIVQLGESVDFDE